MSDAAVAPASATAWAEFQTPARALRLEYRRIAPDRGDAPLVVFLHEGLGSTSMWRDWPDQACEAAGCRGLVYSRYGYGRSTPRPVEEKWPVGFMHEQARDVLPAFLAAVGIDAVRDKPLLYGHSDGGSIALLYASMYPDAVGGIVVAAPHIFVEDVTVSHIETARAQYRATDLPRKLARHHADPDSAFWGWNDIWLDPDFRRWNIEEYLDAIRCPVLALQGVDDEYGTLEQIRGIRRRAPQTRLLEIPACGHSPHRDQPDTVIRAVADFVHGIARPG